MICADRGGGRFELTDGERHLLWTLGKTAALVATARNATRQQERNRRLGERLELAREIHERVMQRLFGVSLALSAEQSFDDRRARALPGRDAGGAQRPAPRARAPARAAARRDRDDAGRRAARVAERAGTAGARSTGRTSVTVPPELEPLAQSVLAEALRNVAKHADPSRIEVAVARDADTFTLEVRNDGVGTGARGAGMGLRLAAFEALQHGGVVEFGRPASGAGGSGWWCRWRRSRRDVSARRERRAATLDDRRKLRVLVVDDHDVVHWGFRVLLGEQPWVERCLAARTGAEALELLRDASARRRARRPVPRRRVRRRRLRVDPHAPRRRRACC